ncbi:MAG: hypothetical protein WC674_04460 [Candidatus Krumholzibacteriia bacterium]
MRKYCIAGLLLLATIVQEGCIFEPRTAETPASGTDQYPWILPNRPKDVFANLKSGVASNRDSNYERSLDSLFTFIPSLDAATTYPGKFESWTKKIELEVLKSIKIDYAGARTVQFGDSNLHFDKENEQGGLATFEGIYMITLHLGNGSAEVYAGIARFTIVLSTQGWVLKTWEDIEASGLNPTSGILRGRRRL